MSFLTDWFASPPPDAAVEIARGRVSVGVVTWRDGTATLAGHASEAVPLDLITPSLTGANITDRATVAAAVSRLFAGLGIKPLRVALVVPDSIAKVSLVRLENPPARHDDLAQIVRWHMRKTMSFPIEDAVVSFVPGASSPEGGREFLVTVARRAAVAEYESVIAATGAEPGVVDLATISLLNLCLGSIPSPTGDWLLVQGRPDSTSIAIMRGMDLVFFRNRTEDEAGSLADLVQQTAMYFQDRLSGTGFTRVVLAGGATGDAVRRSIEERLGTSVETIDLGRAVRLTDRIGVSPELLDALGPAVGMALRAGRTGEAA